ncbi:rhomboid family intramembrane serine protease [Nocardioides lentus]|uniref:Rhomboid family intramembrane serine protease n=1 Tax=Nocardioides lentus TaxID=338077 RepID=A0ABN2NZ97_9ACTN
MTETSGPRAPGTDAPTCYRHIDRETWIRCQRCERPICPDCMHEASVGFQCPDCVREGARATRSGRTAYGGRRPANPALTSIALISVNVGVWLAITLSGGRASALLPYLALRPEGFCRSGSGVYTDVRSQAACDSLPAVSSWVLGATGGAPWQVLTSMFTHVDLLHIAFNMLALWVLGPQLELALGRARFLALYLLSGLAGSLAVLYLSSPYGATVGASTAVFGLMGALLVVGHKLGGNVTPILGWIGINAVITVVGSSFISWQGHLGGLVGGVVVAAVLVYAPRERRTLWQVAGLGAVALVIVAAMVLRAVV